MGCGQRRTGEEGESAARAMGEVTPGNPTKCTMAVRIVCLTAELCCHVA